MVHSLGQGGAVHRLLALQEQKKESNAQMTNIHVQNQTKKTRKQCIVMSLIYTSVTQHILRMIFLMNVETIKRLTTLVS